MARAVHFDSVDAVKNEHQSFAHGLACLETFSFGDGPDLANRLLELVLSGTKCATCWAESQGLLSAEVGKLMVVLDGQGVPKAVLKTIELTKRRFDEVDEAFAYDEGEGDRSAIPRKRHIGGCRDMPFGLMVTHWTSFSRSSLLKGGTVPFQKTSADVVSSLRVRTVNEVFRRNEAAIGQGRLRPHRSGPCCRPRSVSKSCATNFDGLPDVG